MGRLLVFNSVSLDGYFTDADGDMNFAHNPGPDAEWDGFVSGNAQGGGVLLFGRITYDLMVSFWPTAIAAQAMPVVAERMNNLPKVVFSRSMKKAAWNNTTLVRDNLPAEVKKLKRESQADLVVMGSGSIVSQLAQNGLVDEYQLVVIPVVLGRGRTMFAGLKGKIAFRLVKSRVFQNGNLFLRYEPAA